MTAPIKIDPPAKPYDGFPLRAHKGGQWVVKRRGKNWYCGPWRNPDPGGVFWKRALVEYQRRTAEVARNAKADPMKKPLVSVINGYLLDMDRRERKREVSVAEMAHARRELKKVVEHVGRTRSLADLEQDDRPLRKYLATLSDLASSTHDKRVGFLRRAINWAADRDRGGVLDRKPTWHSMLKNRPARARRQERAEHINAGTRVELNAAGVATLIALAGPRLRCWYELAWFGAYEPHDIGSLRPQHFVQNPEGIYDGHRLIHFPRPKTYIDRACCIPATVHARTVAIAAANAEPATPAAADLLLLTRNGLPLVRHAVERDDYGTVKTAERDDVIGKAHQRLVRRLRRDIETGEIVEQRRKAYRGKRDESGHSRIRGLTFLAIRHAAITTASASGLEDDLLTRWQGHLLKGMRQVYVGTLDNTRFVALCDFLVERLRRHGWDG